MNLYTGITYQHVKHAVIIRVLYVIQLIMYLTSFKGFMIQDLFTLFSMDEMICSVRDPRLRDINVLISFICNC